MKTLFYQAMIMTTAACLLVLGMSNFAEAFPSRGGDCTVCHSDPGGAMSISPDPIEIIVEDNGLLSFDVTDLGGSANVAIALSGLTDAFLDASIGGGGDSWTLQSDDVYTSDIFSSISTYTLDLVIGAGATLGDYLKGALLVGKGRRASSFDYTVSVIPEPSADFDTDGNVDGSDFLAWQRGFGTMDGALKGQGDANDDGNVNGADLAIWQTQYGNPPPLSAANTVPEPTTLVLAMLGVASACCWRRNR
jgi:hypothetical protein